MIPDTQKKYIITTENAVDPHGLTVLHVSELINNDEDLSKIATDEEWSSIKTIMRAIISGNVGSYQYLPLMEKARGKGQYSRDISVSASACKQMIDNYADALKGLSETKKESSVAPVDNESSNGIFPTDSVETNEVNEVVPGIADVTKDKSVNQEQNTNVEAVPLTQSVEQTPAAPSILQGVPSDAGANVVAETSAEVPTPVASAAPVVQESTPVAPVSAPVVDTEVPAPVVVEQVPIVEDQTPVVTETPIPVVPTPAVEEQVPVVEVQLPVVEETAPVVEAPTTISETTSVVLENTPKIEEVTPVVVESPSVPEAAVVQQISVPEEQTMEVQSVEPEVTTETPVIAVAEPAKVDENNNQVNIDANSIDAITNSLLSKLKDVQPIVNQTEPINVNSSFAPDATLDQVVTGAQDVFMNGVNNLVHTITERVYRDLYKKEMELNQREELLNQREKMLNEQIAMMVNNFNNNQTVKNVAIDNTSTQVNN